MKTKSLVTVGVLLMLSACMSFSDRAFRPVRDSLTATMPDITLEKEIGIAMGGGLFDFLDVVTFNEADLSEIDHLRVAVYTIQPRGGNIDFSDATFEASLRAKDPDLSWERIVRVREDDEQVWIYAGLNLDANMLEHLSVFVYEQDELVLIDMAGDLNDMLEYAMEPGRGHRGVYSGA